MNIPIRPVMLIFLVLGIAGPFTAEAQTQATPHLDPRHMQFEPVQFTPPEPERLVLDNGMVVYLLEDHELPLVTVTATMRTGGWLDPPDKIGRAAIAGSVMRTGGTQRMSAAEVDEELEHLAAQISIGVGTESGWATLDVLKKDLDRGLRIFGDILMTPAFDPDRLELAKLQTIESIRRRQDLPQSIAGREFSKLLYGPTHPYARENTVESVSHVTREDVQTFHARTIHPNGIILGVTGDFDRDTMLAALNGVFGGWPKGEVPSAMPSYVRLEDSQGSNAAAYTPAPRTAHFVAKAGTQTHVRLGHLSIKESDPDYPALVLLNDVLGGGAFRSRLFQDVRTNKGLAYSIGSSLLAGTREWGALVVRAETKSASTPEVIDRMVVNMKRLRDEPISESELAQAKEAFVNSFIFSFASPAAIVNRLIGLEYDGLPRDFLQQLRDNVVKLTPADLQRVAQQHLHPDRVKLLAVGSPGLLTKQLSTFGMVKEIKLEN